MVGSNPLHLKHFYGSVDLIGPWDVPQVFLTADRGKNYQGVW